MARTEWDVLRSLAKYMAIAAGPDWEVRLDDDAVTFPYMKVTPTTPATYTGSWHTTDQTQGFMVSAYPGEKPTVEAATEAAVKVQRGLRDAFRWGYGKARAMRIPLYDFDGLTLSSVAAEDTRGPSDFVRITDFTSQQLPDPEDRRRVAVVANIRLSWRSVSAVPSGAPLESVTVTPESTGP